MNNKPLFITLLIFTVILTLFSLPLIFAFGRTGKNTTILGKDYSLLTKEQIINRLSLDFPLPQNLILVNESRQFTLNLSSVSASINRNHLASSLLFRRLNQGLPAYFKAFFVPKNFSLEITLQNYSLDSYLNQLVSELDRPFVPSEISLDPKSKVITVKNGQSGQKIDMAKLKQQIITALENYQLSTPITIPVTSVGVLPSELLINQTKNVAAKLIGKSLNLLAPDQKITIDDQTLISWLAFESNCQLDSLNEYLLGLKNSLKKDPTDAVFKFENGKVLDFRSSQNGYQVDTTNLNKIICSEIYKIAESPEKSTDLNLPYTSLSPKIINSQVNDLGIKELLGRGKSTFKHSSTIRNFNVEKGASIVNRILVAPGDTFSFLKNLGEVSLDNGYKKAYVIKKGKTELDVGGGICQVSTTLFRAMLNAGLDITERTPHAYRVSYYEEDSPPGYDATVFIPSPDLKFINDTGHHLLIQSSYDSQNKILVYEIYGTSDGRRVDISNYRRWDATPPPPDVYLDDPTLPPGKIIQDEHRIAGLKTAFDWKVTKNGQIIHQKTFQSSYVPWAAVYRRGPTL